MVVPSLTSLWYNSAGPAWTVSTLLFMYLAFPLILHVFDTCKCLQRPLGLRLVAWGSFCVQAVVAIWLQLQFGSFYVATMTPWSRAGVFVMGMAAARFAQVQHWLSRGRVIAFVSHEVYYNIVTCNLIVWTCLSSLACGGKRV